MDPCPFIRIVIGSLALKHPVSPKPVFSAIHPSSSSSSPSPLFCKIKLKNLPSQITIIPSSQPTCFNLSKTQFDKLVHKSNCILKIKIYSGRRGNSCSGLIGSGKLLGRVVVRLDGKSVEINRSCALQNGWVLVNQGSNQGKMQLHLSVNTEPDPRFVFRFDGEPECSPQVFQVNGNVRQPVFTCKFSLRNSADNIHRSRSSLSGSPSTSLKWLNSLVKTIFKDQPVRERKGWSITIHDLSGSPVAAASMVTPFVPSPGTDRVSRSNPGAWLILRPGDNTWKPWGRLEVWRERGNHLGYRFNLLPDAALKCGGDGVVTVVNSTLAATTGGKFTIDIGAGESTATSRSGSFDLESGDESGSGSGSGSWVELLYRGFVMSSTVEGGGRAPEVEVGVQHVACTEDAAVFVAVAAAMNLSVEACRPFNQNVRKDFTRQQSEEFFV